MELNFGSGYQKRLLASFISDLNYAKKVGHLDEATYAQMMQALERLSSPSFMADNTLLIDIDLINRGLNNYRPAFFSASAYAALLVGAFQGACALFLSVALAPTLPFWSYFVIPASFSLFNYLFCHEQQVAEDAQFRFERFKQSYIHERVAVLLLNEQKYCEQAFVSLRDSPFKAQLEGSLQGLKARLLLLYKQRRLSLEGALGMHDNINEMIDALNKGDANGVHRRLGEMSRLMQSSTRGDYDFTKASLGFGICVSVCVLAMSVVSAGSFPAFCATFYAVSLMTAQFGLFGFFIDGITNLCKDVTTHSKFSAFSSSVKTLFSPLRDKKLTPNSPKEPVRATDQKAIQDEEFDEAASLAASPYLKLAGNTG
jgi:hypothetical protein